MRPEKKFLVDEVGNHLDKSRYCFLADYKGITVSETAELREQLAPQQAEFHVVKNSALRLATRERELPNCDDLLEGPTAIVVGGSNPSEVAKVLSRFAKDKQKVTPKGGTLEQTLLKADDIDQLAKLPDLPTMQAQFLGLLNAPAEQLVRVINAVPQNLLNVLDAKRREDEGEAA